MAVVVAGYGTGGDCIGAETCSTVCIILSVSLLIGGGLTASSLVV